MPLIEKDVIINNKFGMHARPAMRFVEMSNKYSCSIKVKKDELSIDAKSIMGIMRLAAVKGTILTISADGDDADAAVESLVFFVESGFDEPV